MRLIDKNGSILSVKNARQCSLSGISKEGKDRKREREMEFGTEINPKSDEEQEGN